MKRCAHSRCLSASLYGYTKHVHCICARSLAPACRRTRRIIFTASLYKKCHSFLAALFILILGKWSALLEYRCTLIAISECARPFFCSLYRSILRASSVPMHAAFLAMNTKNWHNQHQSDDECTYACPGIIFYSSWVYNIYMRKCSRAIKKSVLLFIYALEYYTLVLEWQCCSKAYPL